MLEELAKNLKGGDQGGQFSKMGQIVELEALMRMLNSSLLGGDRVGTHSWQLYGSPGNRGGRAILRGQQRW